MVVLEYAYVRIWPSLQSQSPAPKSNKNMGLENVVACTTFMSTASVHAIHSIELVWEKNVPAGSFSISRVQNSTDVCTSCICWIPAAQFPQKIRAIHH